MDHICKISSYDIKRVLSFKNLFPHIERSLAAFSRGNKTPLGAIQPLRSNISVADKNGQLLVMPGYLPMEAALATKLVTLFPDNAQKGISTHSAIVVLVSPETGQILALLDGESITELRTAVSSGVASKYLAPTKVKKVAVLGSGVQGAAHVRVHYYLYGQDETTIWSRKESSARNLVKILKQEGIEAVAASSIEEAVKDADIINTCTLSTSPILWSSFVKRGAHVNAVGAPRPDWNEIDPELMTSSVVYTDSREAAMAESGDVIQSGVAVYAEIGDVISGVKKAQRNQTTIYKSLGIAVLDAVSARVAYDLLEAEREKAALGNK